MVISILNRCRKWFVDSPFLFCFACLFFVSLFQANRLWGRREELWAENQRRGGVGSKREGTSSLSLFLLIFFSRFLTLRHTLTESFRFVDEDDNEYEIFSILSTCIAYACDSVILAGKRDSRRHFMTGFSENVLVAWTGYQMWEVLSFCHRERA